MGKPDPHEALARACAAKHRAKARADRWSALYTCMLKERRWMKQPRFTRLGRKLDDARDVQLAAEAAEHAAYLEWSKVNDAGATWPS